MSGNLSRYAAALIEAMAKPMVDRLPWTVRRSLLEHLVERFGHATVVREQALRLGVSSCRVQGTLGAIEGDIRDAVLLFDYAKRQNWLEGGLAEIIRTFEERGGTYLDIGANVGLTTLPVARNPRVHCECFEAEPGNFKYLLSNISFNGPFPNVCARQVAVFEREAELDLEISHSNMGDHRIHLAKQGGQFGEDTRPVVKVRGARLDDLVSTVTQPLAAKIDVQGAEPYVFAGGHTVLAQAQLIVFEFWPYSIRRMGAAVTPMLAFLADHFSQGTVLASDADHVGRTLPIAEVVDQLHEMYASEAGIRFVDVVVRR